MIVISSMRNNKCPQHHHTVSPRIFDSFDSMIDTVTCNIVFFGIITLSPSQHDDASAAVLPFQAVS